MSPLALAWRGLIRQPARAVLAIVGVAAVGALLFDMLMLSRGLALSFQDLLEETGYDVRVTATEAMPMMGPRLTDVERTSTTLAALPEVEAVMPLRIEYAEVRVDGWPLQAIFMGADTGRRPPWNMIDGDHLHERTGDELPAVLVNPYLAEKMELEPGDPLWLRGRCSRTSLALPETRFRVSGIADFPLDSRGNPRVAVGLSDYFAACGIEGSDRVDVLLVASASGIPPEAAVAAVLDARPDLHALTNEQMTQRVQRTDFSYFRQISFVLTTITLFFAFMLVTTLLSVSINQRFAEIAALRALGFTRRRVVANLVWESGLLVGGGSLLAIPIGGLLAVWLDRILRGIPGIPMKLEFFVFEPRTLLLHGALFAVTGLSAALYPIYLASRLQIAATLRNEVVS